MADPIVDLIDLKLAVADQVNNRELESFFPRFVGMAEAALREILYIWEYKNQDFPGLYDTTSGTNWVLQRHPQVYLYLVSKEAAKFLMNVEMTQAYEALAQEALSRMRSYDDAGRWYNGVVSFGSAVMP